MIKKIKFVIKKFLNWKLYFGGDKINSIGNNVTLPYNIRVSGGVILLFKKMLVLELERYSWQQTRVLP